jgi:hypothetical protein
MTAVWIVLIGLAIAIAVMMARLYLPSKATAQAAARKSSPRLSAVSATIRVAPAPIRELDWDSTAIPNDLQNAQRTKLRGRYLAARFPGVAKTSADLMQSDRMIEAARLYFEERKLDRAIELLDLAIGQCPADESLALARLELAFLTQDAALYVVLAAAFRIAHPTSPQWGEVARLGRAIAPEEAEFGAVAGPRATDHYGPWPDMPNWIRAPWDLTAEVRATEFHQAMARSAA